MKKLKLTQLNRLSTEEFKSTKKNPAIVVLDNIRSMNNVGSVFRSCDAFLVEKLFLCGYTPKPPHRDIRKTAIGAEESVEWEYRKSIVELLTELKTDGWKIAAIEQTDASLSLTEFTMASDEKWVVVLGNEVEGVQADVLPICDIALEIPQFGTKHSLNVSVAAGVVLYQMVAK